MGGRGGRGGFTATFSVGLLYGLHSTLEARLGVRLSWCD